jgi:hypothetical protein
MGKAAAKPITSARPTPRVGAGGNNKKKGDCRYCGIPGHWAKECRKKKRDEERREHANLTVGEDDGGPALMLAHARDIDNTLVEHVEETVFLNKAHAGHGDEAVFLNEEKVFPKQRTNGVWYLDTGASSHMTGTKEVFTVLDESVHGTVKFGDGSLVSIRGRGSVLFKCQNGEHRVLTEVYYIPELRSNIISLGQMDEAGCKVLIENGELHIYDRARKLLTRVSRSKNRLYTVGLNLTVPVCMLAKLDDTAWLWHARYGHLHFRALGDMTRKHMVQGAPVIDQVEQVCDGCTLGKQHRRPFPQASSYRAKERLELVHTDLCGPITPATPSGNKYFLLVVDDFSRYMWL